MVVDDESYPVDYKQAEMRLHGASSGAKMQNPIAEGQFFGISFDPRNSQQMRYTLRDDQKNLIFVNIGRDKSGGNMRYKVYRFPEDGGEFYYKDLVEPWRPKNPYDRGTHTHGNIPKLQIILTDNSGAILRQNNFYGQGLSAEELHYSHLGDGGAKQLYLSTARFQYAKHNSDQYRHFLFEPRFLIDDSSLTPMVFYIPGGLQRSLLLFTDTLTYSYSIEMDADDTKNLGSIRMRFP